MSKKKIRFRQSPELYDGVTTTYCTTVDELLIAVKEWAQEQLHSSCEGESFTVSTVLMDNFEFNRLPDV